MTKTLRTQNALPLAGFYLGTIFLLAVIHWGVEEVFKASLQLVKHVLVVAAITTIGGVISNFLSNDLKHKLIYCRNRNVLSGHRCRRICEKDSRLSTSDLKQKWPLLFREKMNKEDQNSYWYQNIYMTVRNEPEVLQAHKSFLLLRDASAGVVLILTGVLIWFAFNELVPTQSVSGWSIVTLLAEYLVLSKAARQSGDRMVSNSVAVALNYTESTE